MSNISQNDMEYIIDMVRQGKMTAAQANVEKVRMARFVLVTKLSADVRKALNEAVKSGYLGHEKKDGLKPEVYFHPDFKHLSNEARSNEAQRAISAIAKVAGAMI